MNDTRYRDNVAKTFGDNLKRIRTEKGISRKDLATAIGISQVTIANYEYGKKTPMLEKVFLIAEILGVAIADLTGENPNAESGKIFEYRLKRAYQMARDYLDSWYNDKPNFDDEGRVVVYSAENVEYDNGVFSFGGKFNSVTFKSKADFVKVMEQAENDALRRQINFNVAFRQIVFGNEPPK